MGKKQLWCLALLITAIVPLGACETTKINAEFASLYGQSVFSTPVTVTEEGGLLIDVHLNGAGPYQFLIDTGSTTTALYEDFTRRIGQDVLENQLVEVRGISNRQLRPLTIIPSLAIGDHQFENKRSVVLPSRGVFGTPGADGLIGLDILSRFALAYDAAAQRLYFIPAEQFDGTMIVGWNGIDLIQDPYQTGENVLFYAEAFVDQRNVPALIDLGSSYTLMNWQDIDNRELLRIRSRMQAEWRMMGAISEFQPRLRGYFDVIYLNDYPFYKHPVLIFDFNSVNITGRPDEPLFIAGADLFTKRDFVADFNRGRLYLPHPERSRARAGTGTRIPGRSSGNVVTFGLDTD